MPTVSIWVAGQNGGDPAAHRIRMRIGDAAEREFTSEQARRAAAEFRRDLWKHARADRDTIASAADHLEKCALFLEEEAGTA
jgi:hypothetical protein